MDELPPSRHFTPQLVGLGAWTDHLHFGYDAVALLRPRVIVELGTDRGESYFTFCQAVVENGTGTRCFAVDSWRGDLHVGGYDEATYNEVAAHNAMRYRAFSTLLRCDFDEAVSGFTDESIDLLHLDGLHTETAVRHDLEIWLPKLRPGGILLMHDVGVQTRGFGVWKVWAELATRGRSFEFQMGPGLGVWEKPPAHPRPGFIETLFRSAPADIQQVLNYYRSRAAEVHHHIAQSWANGSIRDTYFAHQTTVQVFFSAGGIHHEDDSLLVRIGHGETKELALTIPPGGHGALRIDFVSAFTTVVIESIRLTDREGTVLFHADTPETFNRIDVAGDAVRVPDPQALRVQVTGLDPQLYLPRVNPNSPRDTPTELQMKLRVENGRRD